jgi:hypothetical protein
VKINRNIICKLNNYFHSEKLKEYLTHILRACEYKGILAQVLDIMFHKLVLNTCPTDYYRYQFYEDSRTLEEKSRYVGKRGSRYYPYESNAVNLLFLLGDKRIFKALATIYNLPQTKLIAYIGPNEKVCSEDKFIEMLEGNDCDLVLKPVGGTYGKGLLIYLSAINSFSDNGKRLSISDAWKFVENRSYLVEERVLQHRRLEKLHPSSLNTFRMITIKTRDGKWRLGGTNFLRVGRAGRHVDNTSIGVGINADGYSYYAFDSFEQHSITHHPDTKEMLIGLKVPFFKESEKLALSASKKFNYFGTIGWDFGITNDGPVILEANGNYDCKLSQAASLGPLITFEIARGLRRHYFWSRWDKSNIRPSFLQKQRRIAAKTAHRQKK